MDDKNLSNQQKEDAQRNQIKHLELKGDIKSYMKDLTVQMITSTIFFVLALVFILTFARPIFKNTFDIMAFSILLALAIYGTIAGRLEGIQWFQKRNHGLYEFTRQNYLKTTKNIKDKQIQCYFGQWLDKLYEKKRLDKLHTILSNYQINDIRVLDLGLDELCELKQRYKKNWLEDTKYGPSRFAYKYKDGDAGVPYTSFFEPYTEGQIDIIRQIKTSKINIEKLTEAYFMSPSYGKRGDPYYNANNAKKEENTVSISLILSRIIGFALAAVLLANLGFEVYELTGKNDMAIIIERVMDCCSRVFTLFTSIVWGFTVGEKVVGVRQFYLNYRNMVLENYYEEYVLEVFVPVNEQLKRKNAYESEQASIKAHEQKVEEDNKNIEIVNSVDNKPLGLPQNSIINL